jgi:hypothetical protein
VGIPRCMRDFQAEWKNGGWFSTQRLFHSLFPRRLGVFKMRGL